MAIGTPVGTAFVEVQGRVASNFQQQVGGKVSAIMGGVARAAGVALAAGAAAGIAGLVKSVDAASDLAESINAVNVVFGEASGTISEFAATAAREVGLSARAVNQLVTPIGAMFQNVGFGQQEAAEASVELTRVAADMASVFNTDVSEALGAIQAGLRGEADPLERFGIGLNEAAIKAFALRTGLVQQGEAMTDNIKAQARLGLIMEQTARIQGDFANTSDSAANRQRILQARIEDTSAKIGTAFLPIWEKILGGFSTFVDWAAPRVTAFIENQLVPAFNAIGAWWDQNGQQIVNVISTVFGAIGNVIGAVVDVISNVVSGLQGGSTQISGVMTHIGGIVSGIGDIIRTVFNAIKDFWSEWGDEIMAVLRNTFETIGGIISGVIQVIRGVIDVIAGIFTGDWKRAWEGIKNIFGGVWNAIKSIVLGAVNSVLVFFGDFIRDAKENIGRGLENIVTFFRELPGKILDRLKALPGQLLQFGKDLVAGILNGLGDLASSLFNKLKEGIGNAIQAVKDFFGIGSPSKVMARVIGMPLGEGIVAGFAKGLDGGELLRLTNKAVGTISDAAFPMLGGGGIVGSGVGGSSIVAAPITTVILAIDPEGKERLAEFVVDWGNRQIRQTSRAGG